MQNWTRLDKQGNPQFCHRSEGWVYSKRMTSQCPMDIAEMGLAERTKNIRYCKTETSQCIISIAEPGTGDERITA